MFWNVTFRISLSRLEIFERTKTIEWVVFSWSILSVNFPLYWQHIKLYKLHKNLSIHVHLVWFRQPIADQSVLFCGSFILRGQSDFDFLHVIYSILAGSVIFARNETRLAGGNETRLASNETHLASNETRLASNKARGGNLLLSGTVFNNNWKLIS